MYRIMQQLEQEARNHLVKDIIPFWEKLKDSENGGYYGYMGYEHHDREGKMDDSGRIPERRH